MTTPVKGYRAVCLLATWLAAGRGAVGTECAVVTNGDFECGTLAGWTGQAADVSAVAAHGGSWGVALEAESGGELWQDVTTETNATYELSGWARVGADTTGGLVIVVEDALSGATLAKLGPVASTGEWNPFRCGFASVSRLTRIGAHFEMAGGVPLSADLDDVAVTATGPLPDTGIRELWRVKLSGHAHMMIIHEGIVYSQWTDGTLSAVDLQTGTVLRTIAGVANATAPFIVGSNIYSFASNTLHELELSTFTPLRRILIPDAGYQEHIPYDQETGCCFLRRKTSGGTAMVTALRIADAAWVWDRVFDTALSYFNQTNPLLTGDDSVYALTSGRLWRLDKRTGGTRWVADLGPTTQTGYANMAYDRAHDVLYAPDHDGGCWAIRREDGQILWQATFPGFGVRSSLSYANGTVYVPLYRPGGYGALAALRWDTGTTRWLENGYFGEDGWSATAVGERYLYRNTHGWADKLIVQDRFTGKLIWWGNAGAPQPCNNPVQADGIVVFGNALYMVALKVGVGTTRSCPWHGVDSTGYNPGAFLWPADTDGDTLNDQWEMATMGTLIHGPTDDPDGDGATLWEEYVAGTDATNNRSVFSLTEALDGPRLRLSFNPLVADGPGYEGLRRVYALEARDSILGQEPWICVPGFERLETANTPIDITLPMDRSQRFFRVGVWLEPK